MVEAVIDPDIVGCQDNFVLGGINQYILRIKSMPRACKYFYARHNFLVVAINQVYPAGQIKVDHRTYVSFFKAAVALPLLPGGAHEIVKIFFLYPDLRLWEQGYPINMVPMRMAEYDICNIFGLYAKP